MPVDCKNFIPWLVVASLSVTAFDAAADSYRCSRKIVRTGDPVSRLLQICGEPRFKSSGYSQIKIDGRLERVTVKRWHYKKGSRSLEHIVLIYRGKIAAIEVGGR